jgi:hypothetical protein
MVNRYSVFLEFLENSNSHSVFKFEGEIKFIAVTYYLYTSFFFFTGGHLDRSRAPPGVNVIKLFSFVTDDEV